MKNERSVKKAGIGFSPKSLGTQAMFHLMMLPGMLFIAVFSYIPMVGIVMAFEDYVPAKGIFHSTFVGLEHFQYMFELPDIGQIFMNTLIIAVGKILLGTAMAIVFAILLNEIRVKFLKKTIQTIVYLPHFLSWVVLAAVVVNMVNLDGPVNQLLAAFGIQKINFLGSNHWFRPMIIVTDVWFGTELLAAPVTRPVNPSTHMAETDMWLPEGIWFDFFTGEIFEGGKRVQMHRGIRSLPVLAKAGAIIPMTEEIFGADFLKNPGKLILRVYDGSDGAFRLYEDDNETQDYLDGACAMTEIVWKHEKKELHILPVQGDRRLVPEQRDYEIEWYIPADNGAACIKRFSLHEVSAGLGITVVLEG